MSNTDRKFETLADIALIDESEFYRFLPDFVAWFYAAKSMQDLGGTVTNMTWFDDGKPGELSAIDIRTSDGQVERIQVGGHTSLSV